MAVAELGRFRRTLARTKVRSGKRLRRGNQQLAALGPASVTASRLLLAGKGTKRCGGGSTPSGVASTKTTVLSSDANGMRLRVELPTLRFTPRQGGGRTWTQLVLPNTDAPGKPGVPGIPVASSTLGIPDGATLSVKAGDASGYTVDGVDVFPVQPDPVDATSGPTPGKGRPDFTKPPFADKPFTYSAKAYRAKGLTPARPADGIVLGNARDIRIGTLQIPAAQYDPVARKLKVLSSVEVRVSFNGGSHSFSDELGSPWEQPQRRLAASLLNASVVNAKRDLVLRRCGEEMLVITNPATRPAADQFATARRAAGYRTVIAETGSGPGQIGTTPAAIQSLIRAHLTSRLCIRPSYVTILGDDDLVPTFPGINGIPSDLEYALRDGTDELPDVAVGRIIGNDQAAVATAVGKIVGYETTAPTGSFLTKATIAAQFQDDDNDGTENRTFLQFAETLRNGLVGRGVAVDRVYAESPGNNPQRFNDGTALPASLKKPTFAWNGSGADVSAAWNDGRFLMVHRDHGWSEGWSTPGFTTPDVGALTNGAKLPVVLSINCSSGAYDYDETSFAGDALVKANGGAVGVFGDTRDSPTWHNSQIALGFADGLLPSVLPSEGPAAKQRTGDALITGKLRLAGIAPPAGDGNTRNELYLWHYFGDPSMQMWGGGSVKVFDPAVFRAILVRERSPVPQPDPPYGVQVTLPAELAGQPISLVRSGEVIGKAIAGDGSVTIPAAFGDGSVRPGELRVAVEADGAQPISVPVEVPEPAPTPVPPPTSTDPAKTTLTQACPASGDVLQPLSVSGRLTDVPAGTAVEVTFTAPASQPPSTGPAPPATPGRVVVVRATTDAEGRWTAEVTPARTERGSWTVSSAYAGDSTHLASRGGPCSILVGIQGG